MGEGVRRRRGRETFVKHILVPGSILCLHRGRAESLWIQVPLCDELIPQVLELGCDGTNCLLLSSTQLQSHLFLWLFLSLLGIQRLLRPNSTSSVKTSEFFTSSFVWWDLQVTGNIRCFAGIYRVSCQLNPLSLQISPENHFPLYLQVSCCYLIRKTAQGRNSYEPWCTVNVCAVRCVGIFSGGL